MPRPTLFLLHGLGSGARSWDGVVVALGDRFDVVALDLPVSDADASSAAVTQQETAERVAAQVREREPDEWLIAGHGRGGTVAAIVTAWAERGEHGLIAPAGLVLVDPSTPAPEPIAEDSSVELGVLRTPAIAIVGAEDRDLGAADQHRLSLPHVAAAPVHEIHGAGHDVLLEQPREVARVIAGFAQEVAGHPVLPPAFARLIASDRVSARTRRVMLARLDGPGDAARALSPAQRDLLTAVLARVVPQRGTPLDLAGRIDAELAAGGGDGWRFAELPPDPEAWRRGLDTIAAEMPDFASLDAAAQDAAIERIADGAVGSDADGLLTGARMALWFQDVQGTAARVWLSHPATQAWLRYDGFADGGDGPRKQGFSTTHAGEWEAWQRDWRTGKELQA